MGQDLLDIQYAGAVALVIIITLDMYTAWRRHKCISSLHLVSDCAVDPDPGLYPDFVVRFHKLAVLQDPDIDFHCDPALELPGIRISV